MHTALYEAVSSRTPYRFYKSRNLGEACRVGVKYRTYFHVSGKKEEKAEFGSIPVITITLVKNKIVTLIALLPPASSLSEAAL